jgi:hypothetical protein
MLSNVRTVDLKHFENVKGVFEHVSLYIGLSFYTAAGAKVTTMEDQGRLACMKGL